MLNKEWGHKPRHCILPDAFATLSRLAMADVAMVTSWKEFWSWTERAVRQGISLEVLDCSVGHQTSFLCLFHTTLRLLCQSESHVQTACITFWFSEQGCEFTLSQHGPFTLFIPLGQNPFQVSGACKNKNYGQAVCVSCPHNVSCLVYVHMFCCLDSSRKIHSQHECGL